METLGKPPLPVKRDCRSVSPSYIGMESAPVATTFGHNNSGDDSDEYYEKIEDVTESIASNPLYSGKVIINRHADSDEHVETHF